MARWAKDKEISFKELGGACRRSACSRGPSSSAAIVRGRWRMPWQTHGARVDFRSSGEYSTGGQFGPLRGDGIEPHFQRRRVNDSERPSREPKKRRNLAEFIDARSCMRGAYALTASAILAHRKNDVSDQFRTWHSGTKGLKKLPLCATLICSCDICNCQFSPDLDHGWRAGRSPGQHGSFSPARAAFRQILRKSLVSEQVQSNILALRREEPVWRGLKRYSNPMTAIHHDTRCRRFTGSGKKGVLQHDLLCGQEGCAGGGAGCWDVVPGVWHLGPELRQDGLPQGSSECQGLGRSPVRDRSRTPGH